MVIVHIVSLHVISCWWNYHLHNILPYHVSFLINSIASIVAYKALLYVHKYSCNVSFTHYHVLHMICDSINCFICTITRYELVILYNTVTSHATRLLIVQQLAQPNSNENILAPDCWPFVKRTTACQSTTTKKVSKAKNIFMMLSHHHNTRNDVAVKYVVIMSIDIAVSLQPFLYYRDPLY